MTNPKISRPAAPAAAGVLAHYQLEQILRSSPLFETLFARAAQIDLPHWWIAGGCVTQTVWNFLKGVDPELGIRDIELIYFNAHETADGEQAQKDRAQSLFHDLTIPVDVINEARVHEWYLLKFGHEIIRYKSIQDALGTWLPAFAVGVKIEGCQFKVAAPFGLNDLFNRVVRPNKRQMTQEIFEAMVVRLKQDWPEAAFHPWNEATDDGGASGSKNGNVARKGHACNHC